MSNNAAQDALSWSMTGVLPDFTSPNVTLQVNGITYYYVMSKDPAEDVKVYVRNEDAVNGGYIFEEVDDWSGLPGNSIQKNFRFPGIPGEQWGQGSMEIEGNGTISDPSMIYSYRMDITPDQVVCVNPLSDPTCPGFLNAVYKYVSGIQVMTPDEEFYEYWLEFKESQKVELEENDEAEIPLEEDEEDLEMLLRSDPAVGGLVDIKKQEQTLKSLANVPLLHPYYEVEYQGSDYPDKNIIEDKKLPDNNRALRQLAGSARYYSMVRSQYNREELTGE